MEHRVITTEFVLEFFYDIIRESFSQIKSGNVTREEGIQIADETVQSLRAFGEKVKTKFPDFNVEEYVHSILDYYDESLL